ncbi:L domain-like protein [Neocallimastix californiae]|uniref:L domain-like protein n=1 Tax=Neocallimastix californiae TaxID=1754190 RepID=A0A1Y2FSK7_9FUNG|nr:L domain-like protein [Neocallimastix californiae]|eukprot:ORY86567.1 L domain-like protein [Neocallimastix californiae]
MKMNILYIYCFIINIIIIYCNEVDDLKNFLKSNTNANLNYNAFTCNTSNIKCDDESIIELSLKFNVPNINLDFNQFPKFQKLSKMWINGNSFNGKFPASLLERLPNLKHLGLIFGNITEIPKEIKNSNSLEELDLEDNNIKGPLTNEINNFKALEKLYIGKNSMKDELFVSETLVELIINNNEIDKIPEDFFSSTSNLKILNISSNKIKELPISLYSLIKLDSLDISNNQLLKAEITAFNSRITECNFNNTNIECYDKGICENIDSTSSYNECSDQVIKKIIEKTNHIKKDGNNRILTIIIIVAIAIFAIAGFVWMYKSNKKRKDAREADINVSLTVKPSDNYKNNENDNIQDDNDNNYFSNNTQTSFEHILPKSLTTSSSPSLSPVQSQGTNNNFQNLNMNNNSLLVTSQSQIMQNAGTEISTNLQNSNNISTMTSPLLAANTSNMNIVSPVLNANTSIVNNVALQNPNLIRINDTNELANGAMNISLINNNNSILINNFIPNQNNVEFVNGQGNTQPITSLPLAIRTNSNNINNYDPYLLKKLNMAGSSSSSSSNNNNGSSSNSNNVVFTNDYGLTPEEIDDVRLKKKILQEKELSEKYNLLNNKNPNNQSDNDNLPPYSQF